MRLNKKISVVAASALMLLPTLVFSAQSNPEDKAGNYNFTLIGLVTVILILLFVIGMLSNTLRQLALAISDKVRKERESHKTTVLLILALCGMTIHACATEAVAAAAPAMSYISGIPASDFYLLTGIIVLEFMVIFALVIFIKVLFNRIIDKPETARVARAIVKHNWFWDNFNKAVPIEREKDLLLDHNYDGIQELDNSLPPWWKYGFYVTIVVSIVYMYRFHVSHDGLSQQEEYAVEMQQGEEEKAAYLAQSANNVDETSVTQLTDATTLSEGHELFVKTCAACHVADGGGNVGPNLTDEYWLHGGGIKDIFKSIKYGWQDKGMKSWKDDYSPKQIQALASFVKSLKGTHPAVPKAPQGDLYIEASDGKSGADSAKASTDSKDKIRVVAKANKQ